MGAEVPDEHGTCTGTTNRSARSACATTNFHVVRILAVHGSAHRVARSRSSAREGLVNVEGGKVRSSCRACSIFPSAIELADWPSADRATRLVSYQGNRESDSRESSARSFHRVRRHSVGAPRHGCC